MPRKPIEQELIGGRGNRQRIWDAVRAQGKSATWTRYQISRLAEVDDTTCESYLQGLQKAGFIERDHVVQRVKAFGACKGEQHYRLARDNGIEAPRVRRDGSLHTQGLGQEQMWRALRTLKGSINAHELAAHASSSQVTVSHTAAQDYLKTLCHAGYLDLIAPQKHIPPKGSRAQRYALKPTRNTGPRPPSICRSRCVYDPNEARIVWQEPVTLEDAL